MKHKKVAEFLVVLVITVCFLDILVTLPVIDNPNIVEHCPFAQTSSQLLTFGVPLEVLLSVGLFIFYYEIWVKNWLEEEYPKVEFAFLTCLFLVFLWRGMCVVSNVFVLHGLGVL